MRVALVAMSAMGSAEERHIAPAFHLDAFAARRETIASLPSLALLTLAGMTPPEHRVEYYEVDDLEQLDPLPIGFDLVAISSYTAQVKAAYALAERFGKAGVPTVIGGPHASCLPREASRHCTAVAIGEGESVWLRILEDCRAGRLKRAYGSLEADFDLRGAPMPAFELLDSKRYRRVTVETSRGCPNRCEFCASSVLLSNRYKQKPADKVLAEIDRIKEIWPRPFVEFADDNTFANRNYWIDQLLPELAKRKVRWFAEADIRIGDDNELLRGMREAGCAQVLIGLESPSQADLQGVELRRDFKGTYPLPAEDAVRNIQSQGIMVCGCFVLGLDTHGLDVFDSVYDFVGRTGLFDVQTTLLTPFPGTPLYARLRREGRLLEEGAWEKCTLYDINFRPKRMSVDDLAQGYSGLVRRLYDDAFTARRRHNLRKTLRAEAQPVE